MKALNQPESWWGWHGYNHPEPLSITEILRAGTMSPRLAATFWMAVERGLSIVLASNPSGAGKTTILTALLAFSRPDTSVYFTRGWGEQFRLPPPNGDAPTYLLVNEISDHLPVYSWGPYVLRAFELLADGYSLASTMHADTVDGVIEQLVEECDVPERLVGHLALVVPIHVGASGGRRIRRVSDVTVLEPLAAGYDRCTIARWRHADDAFDVLTTPAQINAIARRLGMDDAAFFDALAVRERFLEDLLRDGADEIDDVQARIRAFSGNLARKP